ncbi:zinc finger protein 260-like [Argopecten irradians]|uniref:zinc finger protein 260-like n=1 Tax=Argopecten irradians TaxID=31199 RepID=UPI00371FD4E1
MFGPSKPDLLNFQVSCTRPNCHDSTGVLALPGVVMSYRNQTSTDTKVGITSSSAPYKQPVILIAYNKDNKNGIASRKTLNSKKFREKSDKEIQNKPKGNFPNNNLKKPCNKDVDDSDQGNSFKSSKALSVSDKKCLYCNETVSDMGIHVVLSHPLKAPYKPPLKKQKTKRDGSQLLSNQFSLCHVCGKGFDRRLHLWKHLQVHSTEKQFVCHVCGMSFRLEGTLRHHSLTHTEKRQFKCPVCNKTFNARRYLIKHVRTHVKEKLFECKGCSKRFTTQEYLNTHMRKHISGKLKKFSAFKLPASRKQNVQITHKCDVCDKVFEKRRYLTRHAKIHAEAKRFNCNICGKQFRTQEYVDSHALKMHNIKPKPRGSFSCKICQKKYSNPVWYEKHRKSHHTNTEKTERISDSEAEPQE